MGKKKKKDTAPGEMIVCRNPKATKQFEIEERLEAGMVLRGSEVKSLRERHADLEGAYALVGSGELWLHHMYIGPYLQAGPFFNHEPRRARKLLVHRREMERLTGLVSQKGYTLVPVRVYFKNGRAKVELGLARGRRLGDRRDQLRREQDLREAREAVGRRR